MTRLATSWLVYRLTKSALLLGIVGFAGQISAVFLAPIAGVMVDRWNRHRTITGTQIAAMLQSLALAALALTGTINIYWIIGLTFLQGVINTIEIPARQSFVIQMVEDRADLSNAIALNSSIVNAGRLIGPAIAGLVVAAVGEGYCFLIDGISYMAVIAGLLMMKIRPQEPRLTEHHVWHDLKEGFGYIAASPPLRYVLLFLGVVSLVGAPYTVLPPILAGTILKGGAHTLGFLMAGSGVGALIAAVGLVLRKSVIGLARKLAIAVTMFAAGCALLGVSKVFWISAILMGVAGYGMMTQIVGSNTILQTVATDDKRGRVMSFYTLAFMGSMPVGSLICGEVANRFGAQATFIGSGVVCLLAVLWYRSKLPEIRKAARPRYVELGILPEG